MKAKRSRERILYSETYRKGALKIRDGLLPNLPHVNSRFMVHSGDLLEAGRVQCADGVVREFQVIRFLLTERQEKAVEV